MASWRTALGPHVAPGAKKTPRRGTTIQNPSTPPSHQHQNELTPLLDQRHKATTPATIAAIGKPRPASGSLKKNIDAKDASKTPPPLFMAVT